MGNELGGSKDRAGLNPNQTQQQQQFGLAVQTGPAKPTQGMAAAPPET